MASITMVEMEAYVKERIDANNAVLGNILEQGRLMHEEVKVTQSAVIAEVTDQKERMDQRIVDLNLLRDQVMAQTTDLNDRSINAQTEFDSLKIQLNEFADRSQAEVKRTQEVTENVIRDLRFTIEAYLNGVRAEFDKRSSSADGGGGLFGEKVQTKKNDPKVDKKEVNVWKLADNVSKLDFRHWLDAIDTQLDVVHGLVFPEILLKKIRRTEVPIDSDVFKLCIDKANAEIQTIDRVDFETAKINEENWGYNKQSRFLHSYLLGKLNTDLHSKTLGVPAKNGFELYRLICNIVDAVPENDSFIMGAELMGLVKMHADKIKNLKDLYGFRLLLKRKEAEYEREIGIKPDDTQMKQILWNTMDAASRVTASQAKAEGGNYKLLADHIDGRYKITYGTLEYKTTTSNAMDISLADEYEKEKDAEGDGQAEGGSQGHLDAFGKGKGKGKGWPVNNGRCNVCNGEGHFARHCPSAQGADGKATGTQECYGCHGKGHP